MQKIVCTFFLICLSLNIHSQEIIEKNLDSIGLDTINNNRGQSIHSLKGRIISITDKKPLQSAHVVNLNSVNGTITNTNGQFEIPAVVNDTIFISYIGYQSVKLKVTSDLLKGHELEIAIHEI